MDYSIQYLSDESRNFRTICVVCIFNKQQVENSINFYNLQHVHGRFVKLITPLNSKILTND